MSFFTKLKNRLFRSSSKISEGLDAIVADGGEEENPLNDENKILLSEDNDSFLSSETLNTEPEPEPCLLYTSPSPRDKRQSRMPSSA